jgi:RNA polymerase sigma-70 factor (ECF subfamily)
MHGRHRRGMHPRAEGRRTTRWFTTGNAAMSACLVAPTALIETVPSGRRAAPDRYSRAVSSTEAQTGDDVEHAFVAGRDDALRKAYDAYGRLVFTLCRRSLDAEAAADVTQEVFVAAWQARARFDPERGSLAGWLVAIARNKVIDSIRAQARRPMAARDTDQRDDAAVASAVDATADRLLVAEAMRELPDRAQHVIRLAFFEDLSHQEIAERTSLPLGTVKSDIRRGLARMRRHLERGT